VATIKFIIKQNDLEPPLQVTLLDGTTPVDLTLATGVLFLMKNSGGLKVNYAMVVDPNPTTGKVSYAWISGDTDTVGQYSAEIQVTWPAARPQTFPVDKYFVVDVQKDLGP
jgi:hypothetical protein